MDDADLMAGLLDEVEDEAQLMYDSEEDIAATSNKYRFLLRTSIIIHPENTIALIRNLRHSFSHAAVVAHRYPGPIHVQAAQCTCALRLFAKARWLGAWWRKEV